MNYDYHTKSGVINLSHRTGKSSIEQTFPPEVRVAEQKNWENNSKYVIAALQERKAGYFASANSLATLSGATPYLGIEAD